MITIIIATSVVTITIGIGLYNRFENSAHEINEASVTLPLFGGRTVFQRKSH